MIAIIDYGMGNLGSIKNMLTRLGAEAAITSEKSMIKSAEKLILPGVGAFDKAMQNLNNLGLIPVLNEVVHGDETPILGICLGMQLFSKKSEEGGLKGLGWLDAETVRFRFDDDNSKLRLPHMGWNSIDIVQDNVLFKNMYEDPRFYFVHSYHVRCNNLENVLTTTSYGISFHSSVRKDNIFGTQFHPEKSHKFGMKVLESFLDN